VLKQHEESSNMEQQKTKSVLFLCTGNYYRSRFAEILFNSVAGKMGLAWRAGSRGLALERGVNNIGPLAEAAREALETLGIQENEAWLRFPIQATPADLETADRIIALKHAEHLPLVQERFPSFAERIEYWQIDDAPGALALIEQEMMDMTARLIGGGQRSTDRGQDPACKAKKPAEKSIPVVRVSMETKGRRGKGVTIVSDLPLDEAALRELASRLKQRCGTGGTVEEGRILIQGDQRNRLVAELEGMGYRVKRAGG
jgi:translation initiation factor 1